MKSLSFCLLSLCAISARGYVIENDIQARVESGRVVTDAIDHITSDVTPGVRVFGFAFQEDELDPYFLDDPGFSSAGGLPGNSAVNFNVLHPLRFWSGGGAVGFGAPPTNETLRLNRGGDVGPSVFIGHPQPGFSILNLNAGGTGHGHLNSFLNGADGNAVDDGIVAAEGVYFTAIDLGTSDGSLHRSRPVYLAYNNGLPEPAFEAALSYLSDPLIGDANFDGRVNTLDFNTLAANFGAAGKHYFDGDLNEDGAINSADFALLAGGYGQSNVPVPAAPVPEPSILISATGLLVLYRRR